MKIFQAKPLDESVLRSFGARGDYELGETLVIATLDHVAPNDYGSIKTGFSSGPFAPRMLP